MIHFCKNCDTLNGYADDLDGYRCWYCRTDNWIGKGHTLNDGVRLERTKEDVLREEVERLTALVRNGKGGGQ